MDPVGICVGLLEGETDGAVDSATGVLEGCTLDDGAVDGLLELMVG